MLDAGRDLHIDDRVGIAQDLHAGPHADERGIEGRAGRAGLQMVLDRLTGRLVELAVEVARDMASRLPAAKRLRQAGAPLGVVLC